MTTWVHLNVSEHAIDVESREWVDLWELSILQLCFQKEDFALSSANMTISCHNVASLVDHETSLVDIDVLASLVFAEQKLDGPALVPIKHSYDLLQFKSFTIVVVELGHQTSKLTELLGIKALDTVLIDDVLILIHQKALQGNVSKRSIKMVTQFFAPMIDPAQPFRIKRHGKPPY